MRNIPLFYSLRTRIVKGSSLSFFKKERGSSLIEFALVAPFFILVIFASIQISLIMVIQNALDAAAREAGRYGITGGLDTGSTRDASIQNKVLSVLNTYSGGIINPLNVHIQVSSYPTLSSLDSSGTPVNNTFGLSGQAVLYQISYTWDTIFPLFGSSSQITLTGITPVINEYY